MKKQQKKRRVVSFLLVAVVSFFLVHRALVKTPGFLDKTFSVVLYPFIKTYSIASYPFVAVSRFMQTQRSLLQQVQALQQDNEQLQEHLITAEMTYDFQEETKEIRAFKDRYEVDNAQLAQVIFKQFDGEHFFLLDAGKQKNITENSAVVYKNCLVGKVTHVYPFYSKVTLLTDPACKVASYCEKTKTEGIYQGACNLEYGELAHVDHLKKLKKGDRLYSSGQGVIFPRGFGIGIIKDFKDSGVHHHVTVEPLINVSKIAYCYILQKK